MADDRRPQGEADEPLTDGELRKLIFEATQAKNGRHGVVIIEPTSNGLRVKTYPPRAA